MLSIGTNNNKIKKQYLYINLFVLNYKIYIIRVMS